MTLYSKWSVGKNIMFISGIGMIICLFFAWFSTKQLQGWEVNLLDGYFKQLKDVGLFGDKTLKNIRPAYYAYKLNKFRYFLYLPMIYPLFCLFVSKYKKDLCCLSALVNVIASIIFLIIGRGYWNLWAWVFCIFAIIFFMATTVASPVKEEL